MEQTFHDLLRERNRSEEGTFSFALWMFAETSAEILKEKLATMRSKPILRIAIATAILLLIPLVAMQFTKEVSWSPADFAVAGVLLFGAGLTFELITKRTRDLTYRMAVGLAVASGLLLIWANLAVGIIGDEHNPMNLMYFGVLAVGIIGAVIARFRARGMASALYSTALAQLVVAVIAVFTGLRGSSLAEVFLGNGFFFVLFVLSGLLFQRASANTAA